MVRFEIEESMEDSSVLPPHRQGSLLANYSFIIGCVPGVASFRGPSLQDLISSSGSPATNTSPGVDDGCFFQASIGRMTCTL